MRPAPHTRSALPLFPLPDYFLFPGVVAPLHVFEERYRQMMADLMDGPGRFVVAPYRPGSPVGEYGPVTLPVGTLAEILRHDRLDDGRYVLLVAALARVHLDEVESARLYRLADVRPVDDTDPDPDLAANLRKALTTALEERATGEWEAAPDVTVGRLADLLLHALGPGPDQAARAYLETDPFARARLALTWHLQASAAEADPSRRDEAEG